MLMTTHSGRRVDIANLRAEDIVIEDIAHALSSICRFGGHTKTFYSVAQHSVRVASAVPRAYMLEGLLHDATEAYVGDMVRPLKRILPSYKSIEDNVWQAIAFKYNMANTLSSHVKEADEASLKSELNQFMNGADELAHDYWSTVEALPPVDQAWTQQSAKAIFLLSFAEAIAIHNDVRHRGH